MSTHPSLRLKLDKRMPEIELGFLLFFGSKGCRGWLEVEDAGELERVTLEGRAIGEFLEELHSEVQSLSWERDL